MRTKRGVRHPLHPHNEGDMIRSMTGFGKAEINSKYGRFAIEIRTVNHRYFDVTSRIPNSLNQLEDKIKSVIYKKIKRGKVNVSLLHRQSQKSLESVKVDEEALEKYYRMLNKIRLKFKLKQDITLSNLLLFPEVIIRELPEYDPNKMWPVIEQALKKAVDACNKMRAKEGRVLYRDFSRRIKKISDSADRIAKYIPEAISSYRDKLESKIKELVRQPDYNIDSPRVETEVVMYAKQCDVSEELTRTKSHLVSLKQTLSSKSEAGRRIDFILQEVQREVNTIGAKSNDIRISRLVVEIKGEIEKMREQAQNIE